MTGAEEEEPSEPEFDPEGCEACEESGFDAEQTWDPEQGLWVCSGCGGVQ